MEAAREGKLEEIIDLVRYQGVDVNSTSKVCLLYLCLLTHQRLNTGNIVVFHLQLMETAVMLAAHNGHVAAVKSLVSMNADLMATDKVRCLTC
jgi:hypothetical protein